jgi:hypothetical protein
LPFKVVTPKTLDSCLLFALGVGDFEQAEKGTRIGTKSDQKEQIVVRFQPKSLHNDLTRSFPGINLNVGGAVA